MHAEEITNTALFSTTLRFPIIGASATYDSLTLSLSKGRLDLRHPQLLQR